MIYYNYANNKEYPFYFNFCFLSIKILHGNYRRTKIYSEAALENLHNYTPPTAGYIVISSVCLSVNISYYVIYQKPLLRSTSNYHSMCILWVSSPEKIMVMLCCFSKFFVNFSILPLTLLFCTTGPQLTCLCLCVLSGHLVKV